MIDGVDKQRARTDDDKRTRRDDILDAARAVFDATEFDAFTMDAVATKLGLVKGTLYRYFPTREGLLLALTGDEYTGWFDAVDARLREPARATTSRSSVERRVTALLVDEVVTRERFMRLLALVPTVLERNVPFDTARAFKVRLMGRIESTAVLLATPLHTPVERSVQLLFHLQAAVIGLFHHAHPAPIVAEVLEDPALAALRIDLRLELTHAVAALVAAARP
jgi:AcrR family transcriptional regulator